MPPSPRRFLAVLLLLSLSACQGGMGPLEVREISAEEVKPLLEASPRPLIVDTRPRADFEAGHLPGAMSMTFHAFEAYATRAKGSRDRPLLAVCDHGSESLLVAALATEHGFAHAFSMAGGMRAWADAASLEKGAGAPVEASLIEPAVIHVGLFEQVLVVISGLVLKPTYMVLSLILILLLWRASSRGLSLVRQSMVLFLFGEGMCALNYVFTSGASDPLDLMHGLGMLGMGILLPWGAAVLLDERVLRYEAADATCAFQRFCGHCWKREPVACGLHRLFQFAAPAMALVSVMPLTAGLAPVRPTVQVFDSQVVYAVTLPVQLMHFRLYPLVAVAAFLLSFLLLFGGRRTFGWAQRAFFVGLGFASFSLFKFFLFRTFRGAPWWADFWEEATELLATLAVLVGLFVFRRQLGVLGFLDRFLPRSSSAPEPDARVSDG